MHHPISGINSLIHSVSFASHVSTHFLNHLSAHLWHLCHHHHSHNLSLIHSVTPSSKPTFLTNPSHHLSTSTLDCLHDHGTGPDLSRFSMYFQFVFLLIFLSVPCGGLSWPLVSFILHVKYTLSHCRIVLYHSNGLLLRL